MFKGILDFSPLLFLILLAGCSRLDRRPECKDQSSRPRSFDYTTLACGPQVAKYTVYRTDVSYSTEQGSSQHLGGDSTFFKIPDDYMSKADSLDRSTAFWDSILPLVNIYDISPRNWGPSPGQDLRGGTHWTLCAQFTNNETDVPISEALAPVSSMSEAFLIAERELEDYWIIDSSEELGQGIRSTTDGYSMRLLHFQRKCPNQLLGLVEVMCKSNGRLEVVQNANNVRTYTCQCGSGSLP